MIFKPTAAFVFAHPARILAFGFGSGLAPFAPGTVGTLVAYPIWWALALALPQWAIIVLLLPLFGVGVWACGVTGRHLGISDHGSMVWDEVVAFVLILALIPQEVLWQIAAFFVFRFFDVVKPPPIRQVEIRVKGGLGVMLDDILAAGYTLLCLAFAHRFLG
jgi:phosphatidylglycerophosphatase A